jgi:hypothetical protein
VVSTELERQIAGSFFGDQADYSFAAWLKFFRLVSVSSCRFITDPVRRTRMYPKDDVRIDRTKGESNDGAQERGAPHTPLTEGGIDVLT